MKRKLIIVGLGQFAEIAYEYFTHDSNYEVAAFSVNKNYIKEGSFFGLPVVAFENLAEAYSPAEHEVFVAVLVTELNRARARLCAQAKEKGYKLASYVSSRAFV